MMYEKFFQYALNPFFEKVIKRRKMLDYRAFLEKSQWWSRDELLKFQWKELEKLLAHAGAQVPYFRDIFSSLGLQPRDIQSYQDFLRLPITEKSDIRRNKEKMIADNFRGKTWTKATGGSTGIPLELDYTPDSYDWRVAISKRGYAWAGCEDGMKQAWIWGADIGEKPKHKSMKENLHKRLLGQKVFNCFAFDEKRMEEALIAIDRYKPKVIVGYTNPLHNFAKFVGRKGGLSFTPQSIISAAEKLEDFQRQEIQSWLGAPVFNTYGSREFMLIAAEDERHDGLLLSVENLLVEVVKEDGSPAQPGEMGDVVITDLHNLGMPFIRYRIGDMAVVSGKRAGSKRGLPMLEKVVGRSLDILRTPEGKAVPGEFFPHLMKEFKGVERFQVIQNDLRELDIKIIKNHQFTDPDLAFMDREIKKVMGTVIKLNYCFVDDIPLTKTGKFRVTVNNMQEKKGNGRE